MSAIESRSVSTTGGIFRVEDYQIYRMVAKGLKAVGQIVSITEGIPVDDFGIALEADSVRLVIGGSAPLIQDFWKVSESARKQRKLLVEKGVLPGANLNRQVGRFVAREIHNLHPQARRRE